jgi:MoxR-like ATPase
VAAKPSTRFVIIKEFLLAEHGGITAIQRSMEQVQSNMGRAIVGKSEIIEQLVIALLCEGHVLLEDVPGTGKTSMARALAASLGCSFQRIQFTPDLLPTDISGLSFFNQQASEFQFRAGPIFANIVLTDEINRATPRTQSALLEAMQERTVTVDGTTRPLPAPFLVIATQNPIELEGTFPLPEAQLDRFLLRLALGYPSREEEEQILSRYERSNPLNDLAPVLSAAEVLRLQGAVREVQVSDVVRRYMVELVRATRSHGDVELGASPRASLALFRTAQARAAIRGREYVLPDDAKALASAVLGHRIIITPEARLRGRSSNDIVRAVLDQVAVPVE